MRLFFRLWPVYVGTLLLLGGGLLLDRSLRVRVAARQVSARAAHLEGDAEVEFWFGTGEGRAEVTTESAAQAGVEGLGLEGIRGLYPGWRVVAFTPNRLILRQDVPALKGPLYLGIKNGQVAIFSGRPGEGRLWQLTGIQASLLLREDRERLERGIPVSDLRQAWRELEGLRT